VICDAGFYNAFYYFGYERKVRDWTAVRQLILSKVDFLRCGEITDSLRMGWNWPEVSERLTILVIVGTSTDEHSLTSQVGMGSESDCLLGQFERAVLTATGIAINTGLAQFDWEI